MHFSPSKKKKKENSSIKCTLSIVNVERSNREYFVLSIILLPSQLHCFKKRKNEKKKSQKKKEL